MGQGVEIDETRVATTLRPVPHPRTRRKVRALAMTAYAGALTTWSLTLGIPNDTVQVFLWLWLGTVAWNIEARPRYHLNFLKDWWLPVVGLVIYFFSRGLTDGSACPST